MDLGETSELFETSPKVKQSQSKVQKINCRDLLSLWNKKCSFKKNMKDVTSKYPNLSWKDKAERCITTKIHRLRENVKVMRRNKQMKLLESELDKQFLFREAKGFSTSDEIQNDKINILVKETKTVIKENRTLKRKFQETKDDLSEIKFSYEKELQKQNILLSLINYIQKKYAEIIKTKSSNIVFLQKECSMWEKKFQTQTEALDKVDEKIESLQQKLGKINTRNVNKKLKRRQKTIDKHFDENKQIKQQLDDASVEIKSLNDKLEQNKILENDLKKSKLSLQKKISYLKNKLVSKTGENSEIQENNDIQIVNLQREINEKEALIKTLESANEFLLSDTVCTFADGKYTNDLRECVMKLLTDCNVSMSKMKEVIVTVLNKLGGKAPTRLPSKALMSRFMVEAKILASKHVVNEMLSSVDTQNLKGGCLHSDGTTKHFKHYEGYQISLPNSSAFTLGLKEVGCGDAKTLLESFKDTLSDLAEAVTSDEENKHKIIGQLTVSILTMMTDGAAVNHAFVKEFENFRSTLLPTVIQNLELIPEQLKNEILSVSHFLCKMHPLVNFASSCDDILKVFERNVISGRNPFTFDKDESGTIRLIRTAAKSLTSRGSDKAGVHSHWISYLQDNGKKDHLLNFVGNRFNIVFREGAAIYFHKDDISDFYDKFINPNLLSKSVHFDVQEKLFIAGARSLGIISKLITEPYEYLVNKLPNVLSLNPYLNQLKLSLERFSEDASPLLSGDEFVFSHEQAPIEKDEVFDKLFENSADPTLETYTQMCLELMLKTILLILERQCKDNLPEGKFWQPSDELKIKSQNVPTSNIISERDMGILDYIQHIKPNASTISIEAAIMWTNNKTSKWLDNLPETEKNMYMDDARKKGGKTYIKFRERESKIKLKKIEQWRRKQNEKQIQHDKELDEKVRLSLRLNEIGGLWALSTLDEMCDSYGNSDNLWTQILYHKKVLKAKGHKELFQKSKNKQSYTINEMKTNLKQILDINKVEVQEPSIQQGLCYAPLDEMKKSVDQSKQSIMSKLIEARNKQKNFQQQQLLPEYIKNPQKLVGCYIKPLTKDAGCTPEWFFAKVIKCIPSKDPLKSKYHIKYDVDQSELYVSPLLLDLRNGEMILQSFSS